MTEQTPTTPPSPRFAGLLLGILHRPRMALQRLIELPRWPWRRMALLVIVAVILPVVATYSATRQAASFEGALSSQKPAPGPVRAVPMAGGVVRVGPAGAGGMPPGEAMPAPGPSPITGLALPALGRLGGLVLNWALWSGVLYVIGTMMGGRHTFGQMLRMVIWTWAPFAVRGVLQAGYIWLTQVPTAHPGLSGFAVAAPIRAGVPAPSGAGTLMWQTLLSRVDIYLLWHLALVVIGLMVVARLPKRKAVALALTSWVVLTLLSLLPAVIQGSIAGLQLG